MSRALALGLLLLTVIGASEALAGGSAPVEMERFLESRQVIGVIPFAEGSSALSPEAAATIDRLMPMLRKIDPATSLVRIEGFATPGGGDRINVPMSMTRARSVIDYILGRHPLAVDLFLSGFRAEEGEGISDLRGCRAEIAVYDNIWQFQSLTTEVVYQR